MKVARASLARRTVILTTAITLILCALWATRHVATVIAVAHGHAHSHFALIFTLAFLALVWQVGLYTMERPHTATDRQRRQLDALNVVVSVPLYNEDPALLRRCLQSILEQTRLPQLVFVVDDGSKVDYSDEERWFATAAGEAGVAHRWVHTPNGGKRHAQGVAVRGTPDAEIYVTIDSDAILAPNAVEELLLPFAKEKVQSVAGIVLAANNRKNLLTRFTDLWFVTGQLVDRSAMSTMGAVLVNSGVLAAYRAAVIRDNLTGYLSETFFGRPVEFSDDSMLTIYALDRGDAVQQPTAFAFTAMPERLSHHFRQYLRWMRGAFIRSWWRFRYLPVGRYSYWGHFLGWVQMTLSTIIFLMLFIVEPIRDPAMLPYLFVIPLLVGYGQSLRYLSFRRADESIWSQLLTVALSPIATLWSFVVLRIVRWYAIATCLKTGWGTRQSVEVTLADL